MPSNIIINIDSSFNAAGIDAAIAAVDNLISSLGRLGSSGGNLSNLTSSLNNIASGAARTTATLNSLASAGTNAGTGLNRAAAGARTAGSAATAATTSVTRLGAAYTTVTSTLTRFLGAIRGMTSISGVTAALTSLGSALRSIGGGAVGIASAGLSSFRNILSSLGSLASRVGGTLGSGLAAGFRGIAAGARMGANVLGQVSNALNRGARAAKNFGSSMSGANRQAMQFFSAGWSYIMGGQMIGGMGRSGLNRIFGGLSDYLQYEQLRTKTTIAAYDFSDNFNPSQIGKYLDSAITGLQRGSFTKGTPIPLSSQDLMQGAYYYAAALGLPINSQNQANFLAQSMAPVMQTAAFTGTSVNTATKGILNALMEFGVDPRQQQNLPWVSQMAGKFGILANQSSLELTDILSTFGQMGPMVHMLSGKNLGQGLNDALLMTYLTSEMGSRGSRVGSGISQMMNSLLDPTPKMNALAQTLFGGNIKDTFFTKDMFLKGGVQGMLEKFLGLSDSDWKQAAAGMFTQNATKQLIPIIEQMRGDRNADGSYGGKTGGIMALLNDNSYMKLLDAASKAYADSVQGHLTDTKNAWNEVQRSIVQSIQGPLKSALSLASNFFRNIADVLNDNPAFTRFLTGFATIASGAAAALGSLLTLVGTTLILQRALMMSSGALSLFGSALAVLPRLLLTLTPMLLLLGAAAVLLKRAWETNFLRIQDIVKSFTGNFSSWLSPLIEQLTLFGELAARVFENFVNAKFDDFLDYLEGVDFSGVLDFFQAFAGGAIQGFAGTLLLAANAVAFLVSQLQRIPEAGAWVSNLIEKFTGLNLTAQNVGTALGLLFGATLAARLVTMIPLVGTMSTAILRLGAYALGSTAQVALLAARLALLATSYVALGAAQLIAAAPGTLVLAGVVALIAALTLLDGRTRAFGEGFFSTMLKIGTAVFNVVKAVATIGVALAIGVAGFAGKFSGILESVTGLRIGLEQAGAAVAVLVSAMMLGSLINTLMSVTATAAGLGSVFQGVGLKGALGIGMIGVALLALGPIFGQVMDWADALANKLGSDIGEGTKSNIASGLTTIGGAALAGGMIAGPWGAAIGAGLGLVYVGGKWAYSGVQETDDVKNSHAFGTVFFHPEQYSGYGPPSASVRKDDLLRAMANSQNTYGYLPEDYMQTLTNNGYTSVDLRNAQGAINRRKKYDEQSAYITSLISAGMSPDMAIAAANGKYDNIVGPRSLVNTYGLTSIPHSRSETIAALNGLQNLPVVGSLFGQMKQGNDTTSDMAGAQKESQGVVNKYATELKKTFDSAMKSLGIDEDSYNGILASMGIDIAKGDLTPDKWRGQDITKESISKEMEKYLSPDTLRWYKDEQAKAQIRKNLESKGSGWWPGLPGLGDGALAPSAPDETALLDFANAQAAMTQQWQDAMTKANDYYTNMTLPQAVRSGLGNMGTQWTTGEGIAWVGDAISKNIPEGATWSNIYEAIADSVGYGGGSKTGILGKNLHNVLAKDPGFQNWAQEMGTSVNDMLKDVPNYVYADELMPQAFAGVTRAIGKMAEQGGAVYKAWDAAGIQWADVSQFAISKAMAGEDWNFKDYLIDGLGMTLSDAEAWIAQNGGSFDSISSGMFSELQIAMAAQFGLPIVTQEDYEELLNIDGLQDAIDGENNGILEMTQSQLAALSGNQQMLLAALGVKVVLVPDKPDTKPVVDAAQSALDNAGFTGPPGRGGSSMVRIPLGPTSQRPDGTWTLTADEYTAQADNMYKPRVQPPSVRPGMGFLPGGEGGTALTAPSTPSSVGPRRTGTPRPITLTPPDDFAHPSPTGRGGSSMVSTGAPVPPITGQLAYPYRIGDRPGAADGHLITSAASHTQAVTNGVPIVQLPNVGTGSSLFGNALPKSVPPVSVNVPIVPQMQVDAGSARGSYTALIGSVVPPVSPPVTTVVPLRVQMQQVLAGQKNDYSALAGSASSAVDKTVTTTMNAVNNVTPAVANAMAALNVLNGRTVSTTIANVNHASPAAINAFAALNMVNGKVAQTYIYCSDGATAAAYSARAALVSINGYVATTYIQTIDLGTAGAAARNTFASGGYAEGGYVWVGERGKELVRLPQGSYVHNHAESTRMLNEGFNTMRSAFASVSPASGGGQASSTSVHFHGDIHVRSNSDIDAIADRVNRTLGEQQRAINRGVRAA